MSEATFAETLAAKGARRLVVEYAHIDHLKLDPNHARIHGNKQIRQIAKSIESYGFNVPVLVGAKLNVIAGHGRLLACEHLGRPEVPTIRLEHLTAAQHRAWMIADDRLTQIATQDDRLLAEQLELASVDLDFDIETTGFDMGEIDLRIESLKTEDSGPAEPPNPFVSRPAVSQTGDLWLLDRHRLLCGIALDVASYTSLRKM